MNALKYPNEYVEVLFLAKTKFNAPLSQDQENILFEKNASGFTADPEAETGTPTTKRKVFTK